MTVSDHLVYLAGPVSHHSTPRVWRAFVEADAPFDVVNPMDYDYDGDDPAGLVDQCFRDIKRVDGVLVGDTGHRSPGTWREVQYAHGQGIPVVIWDIDSEREDFIEVYPVRANRREAIETLQRMMEAESYE